MINKKTESNIIIEIIKDPKNKSNSELQHAMDFINEDFNLTKESLIKLTNHLDKLERSYNLLLKEYKERNGQK